MGTRWWKRSQLRPHSTEHNVSLKTTAYVLLCQVANEPHRIKIPTGRHSGLEYQHFPEKIRQQVGEKFVARLDPDLFFACAVKDICPHLFRTNIPSPKVSESSAQHNQNKFATAMKPQKDQYRQLCSIYNFGSNSPSTQNVQPGLYRRHDAHMWVVQVATKTNGTCMCKSVRPPFSTSAPSTFHGGGPGPKSVKCKSARRASDADESLFRLAFSSFSLAFSSFSFEGLYFPAPPPNTRSAAWIQNKT